MSSACKKYDLQFDMVAWLLRPQYDSQHMAAALAAIIPGRLCDNVSETGHVGFGCMYISYARIVNLSGSSGVACHACLLCFVQMQDRKLKEREEEAADMRLAEQVNQQKKQYDEEIKSSKAALKLQKKSLLKELEQGMKLEAKQRFRDQRGMVEEKDRWLHKPVLEGKSAAFC